MLLPPCTAREMWLWISRLACVRWSRVLLVMTGRRAASGGKSHSWVTATSWSPGPSAKAISVALGRSEQILRLGVMRSKGSRGLLTREGVKCVPVELLVALEEPGRSLDVATVGAPGETPGNHGHRLALELNEGPGEEIKEGGGLLGKPVAVSKGPAHAIAVGTPRREVHQEAGSHLGFPTLEGEPGHKGRIGVGARRGLVGLKPRLIHSHGGREGPERCQRRRLSAEHRLEERSGGRRAEAIHEKRNAPKVAADDVVLLPREAGE